MNVDEVSFSQQNSEGENIQHVVANKCTRAYPGHMCVIFGRGECRGGYQ